MDTSRVGAHQERFSFVVPAGSNERTLSQRLAFEFCSTRLPGTERRILWFILCSSGPGRMSSQNFNHTSNNTLAVGCPCSPRFAGIRVTAQGMCPKVANNALKFMLFSESRLMSRKIHMRASSPVGWMSLDCQVMTLSQKGLIPCMVTRMETCFSIASFRGCYAPAFHGVSSRPWNISA